MFGTHTSRVVAPMQYANSPIAILADWQGPNVQFPRYPVCAVAWFTAPQLNLPVAKPVFATGPLPAT